MSDQEPTVYNGRYELHRQIARGGTGGEDWYIGFNISRKFY